MLLNEFFFFSGSHGKVMRISKQITKVSQLGSSLNKNFHLSSLLEGADDMSAMLSQREAKVRIFIGMQ